jgi:tRNA/tmRNA/rRNA uracil-C5-methylase (TrmA/RlmC/RlmD family)
MYMNNLRINLSVLSSRTNIILVAILVGTMIIGNSGCANKKKLSKTKPVTEQTGADKDQIQKAKARLLEIINDDGSIPYQEKENTLKEIIAMNLQDPEIDELIRQAQQKLNAEKAKMAQEEEKTKEVAAEEDRNTTETILNDFFNQLVTNSNYDQANLYINQAMKMFENESVPVLIIISESGGMVDYDEPTTIKKYLEYLNDTKKNLNEIKSIKVNEMGLITELELIKK